MTSSKLGVLRLGLICIIVSASAACKDDNGTPTASGASSESAGKGGKDEKPDGADGAAGRKADAAGGARSGPGSSTITKATCKLAANGVAQGQPECVDCWCEAVAKCGQTCEELLLCIVSKCAASFSAPADAASCALRECRQTALESDPNAIGAGLEALTSCSDVCQAPAAPPGSVPPTRPNPPTRPLPPGTDGSDAGTSSEDDGGV